MQATRLPQFVASLLPEAHCQESSIGFAVDIDPQMSG